MKTLGTVLPAIALVLVFSLPASAAPKKPLTGKSAVNTEYLRLVLNGYAAYAEEQIAGTLGGLKLLSYTEEVKSCKWADMKGLLGKFKKTGINAAAVWFARPDGSYYTVRKGLQPRKLSDRPYFPDLMAGKDVVGYLVISKSTGARSAVIAVPVKNDAGKVVGALGVSVSAEDMSKAIDEKLDLPKDMIFYALAGNSEVSLHTKSSLLHVFPSDLGSPTLNHAIKKMLSEKEGVVNYEFQGSKTVVFRRAELTGWTYAIGFVKGR